MNEFYDEAREQAIVHYREQERKHLEDTKKLRKINEQVLLKIRSEGKVPQTYTCQKCNREFATEEDFEIIRFCEPTCCICGGGEDGED